MDEEQELITSMFLRLVFIGLLLSVSQYGLSAGHDPEELVAENSQQIENLLNQIPIPRDTSEVATVLERYLFPHIDQERIVKLVMGKAWKKSSLKQKKQFQACFMRQIITTYSEIFSEQEMGKGEVDGTEFNDTRSKAAVTVSLATEKKETELIFRLYKSKTGWRYYDVAVDKISLVKNYRDSYTTKFQQQGLAKTLAAVCKQYPDTKPLVVLAGHSWPPYIGQGLPGGGLSVELVRQVMERAGYSTRMVYTPWQKVGKGIERGDYDMSVATWFTKERDEQLLFTEPYFENSLIAVTKKQAAFTIPQNKQSLTHVIDQKHLVLGAMKDYAYGELIPAKANVFYGHKYSPLFRRLSTGRLDLLLLEQKVAEFYLKRNPALRKHLVVHKSILDNKPLHATLSKKHAKSNVILKAFNESWRTYKNSPQHHKLLQKYRMSSQ